MARFKNPKGDIYSLSIKCDEANELFFRKLCNVVSCESCRLVPRVNGKKLTRRATQKLDIPFRKSCIGQKTLSYIGPKIWNNLPAQIKLSKSVNTFKHDIKKSFFDDLQKQNDNIFFYY